MTNIHTEVSAGVQVIEIRRPEKRNALTEAMYQALGDAMASAERDPDVRVILIRGQTGLFTSGNDVVDFLEHPPTKETDPVFQFLSKLILAEKPIVAAVSGLAVGIGTTLLLHCDYVVAGQGAEFSVPFVNLGLCPEAGSSLMLPLSLGYKRAAELLMFGDKIDAGRALDWGLVNLVVPDEEVSEIGLKRARVLAAKPATALKTTKALLKSKLAPLAAQAMTLEAHQFHRLLGSVAARECLSAFVEKRRPDPTKFI